MSLPIGYCHTCCHPMDSAKECRHPNCPAKTKQRYLSDEIEKMNDNWSEAGPFAIDETARHAIETIANILQNSGALR